MQTQTTTTNLAVGLCRVSGETQEKEGYSLSDQDRRIRAAATERGLTLLGVERDVISGTLLSRPGLDRVLALVQQHRGLTVISVAADRLSRGGVGDGFYLKRLIELAGGRLLFLDEGIDADDADADIKLFLGFYKARGERDDIVKRTGRGRAAKIAEGKLPGNGPAPYGYRWRLAPKGRNANHLVRVGLDPDPALVPIVRRMFDSASHGKTLSAIADDLHAAGVPTPGGAHHWRPGTISYILRNPTYYGGPVVNRHLISGSTASGGRTDKQRPREEWIEVEGAATPVVDRETWDRAQAALDRNRSSVRRPPTDPEAFLVRGRAFCALCGAMMTPRSNKYGHRSYRCTNYPRHRHSCPNAKTVPVVEMHADIWSRLVSLILNPERLAAYVAGLSDDDDPTATERAAARAAMADLSRQRDNLLDNLRHMSGSSAVWIRDQLDALARDVDRHEARLADLDAQAAAWDERRARMAVLAGNLAALAPVLEGADFERKRWLLSVFDVRVTIYPQGHEPRWTATWNGDRVLSEHGSIDRMPVAIRKP